MKAYFVIFASLILCLLLQILPLPAWAIWFRPEWIILVLIYWSFMNPQRVGVIAAFIVGLGMDLLTGTLLGQHALAYTIMVYFTIRFCPLLRQAPSWQQGIYILVMLLLFETFQLWIWGIRGGQSFTWMYWLPAIVSAFIWPWIYNLMRTYQRFYRVF